MACPGTVASNPAALCLLGALLQSMSLALPVIPRQGGAAAAEGGGGGPPRDGPLGVLAVVGVPPDAGGPLRLRHEPLLRVVLAGPSLSAWKCRPHLTHPPPLGVCHA